ncbi:MAG: hypothetical protein ACTSV5_06325 [Promethearchaeota archaeon]
MAVPKILVIVFTFFYLAIIIYLLLFLTIPEFQAVIINSRLNMAILTEGSNYFLALLLYIIAGYKKEVILLGGY